MRTWARRTLIVIAVLLALIGAAYYWLVVESHMPRDAAYTLDLERLHAALETVPGDKPSAIQVEEVAVFIFPATGVVAGDGWGESRLPVYSYRLIYPDNSSIIVDTGLTREMGGSQLKSFDAGKSDASKHDALVKTVRVNWGICALVYLVVGKLVERLIRP